MVGWEGPVRNTMVGQKVLTPIVERLRYIPHRRTRRVLYFEVLFLLVILLLVEI